VYSLAAIIAEGPRAESSRVQGSQHLRPGVTTPPAFPFEAPQGTLGARLCISASRGALVGDCHVYNLRPSLTNPFELFQNRSLVGVSVTKIFYASARASNGYMCDVEHELFERPRFFPITGHRRRNYRSVSVDSSSGSNGNAERCTADFHSRGTIYEVKHSIAWGFDKQLTIAMLQDHCIFKTPGKVFCGGTLALGRKRTKARDAMEFESLGVNRRCRAGVSRPISIRWAGREVDIVSP
jgi:hypothetical protein